MIATSPLINSPAVTPKRESKEIGKRLFSSQSFVNNEKQGSATEFKTRKNTNVYLETRKNNCGQVFCAKSVTKASDYRENDIKTEKPDIQRRSVNNTVNDIEDKITGNKNNLVAYETSFSETSTANSSSDESCSEVKTDIKKLKELLATKRSNFFYGNNSPENIDRPETRSCEYCFGDVRS